MYVMMCVSLNVSPVLTSNACRQMIRITGTDHGTFFNSDAHRCQFVNGRCRNGGNIDEDGLYRVARKCVVNTCERRVVESQIFPDLSKSLIWRMKQDDLVSSCEERKLRAVNYDMNVNEIRRVLRFYEGFEDQKEMSVLNNLKEESDEQLEELCVSNQLRDPLSKCRLSFFRLRFRSGLEKTVERYLKLRLTESDINSEMSEAELRAASKKRGLLDSGLDANELRQELELYECWSDISNTNFGYERCRRDSVLDRLNGDTSFTANSRRRFQSVDIGLRTNDDE